MSTSESLGTLNEVTLPQGTVRYRERGTGQPLVFVHGLLVNGDLWRKVVPELSKDFRCITPDWPLGSHECHCAWTPTSALRASRRSSRTSSRRSTSRTSR